MLVGDLCVRISRPLVSRGWSRILATEAESMPRGSTGHDKPKRIMRVLGLCVKNRGELVVVVCAGGFCGQVRGSLEHNDAVRPFICLDSANYFHLREIDDR